MTNDTCIPKSNIDDVTREWERIALRVQNDVRREVTKFAETYRLPVDITHHETKVTQPHRGPFQHDPDELRVWSEVTCPDCLCARLSTTTGQHCPDCKSLLVRKHDSDDLGCPTCDFEARASTVSVVKAENLPYANEFMLRIYVGADPVEVTIRFETRVVKFETDTWTWGLVHMAHLDVRAKEQHFSKLRKALDVVTALRTVIVGRRNVRCNVNQSFA